MRRSWFLGLCALAATASPAWAATTYVAGEALAPGDVVTFNSAGEVVRTTATDAVVVGVVYQSATLGQPVPVETTDDITVNVAAGTGVLQYLGPSTTPGVALGSSVPTSATFGYSRTAESGGACSMQFLRPVAGGEGGTHPVDLATDTTGIVPDGNVAATVHRDSETKDGDLVSFDDPDGNFTATDVDSAIAELDDTDDAPNDGDGMVDWDNLESVPNDFADGEVDASDFEEVQGIPMSKLTFFAGFDDVLDANAALQFSTVGPVNPTASGNGWMSVYRLDCQTLDTGTSGLDAAAGTALPSGVACATMGPTPLGVDMGGAAGGTGATTDYLAFTGEPDTNVTSADGLTVIAAFGNSAATGTTAFIFDFMTGTNGVSLNLTPTQYQWFLRDGDSTIHGFTVGEDVTDSGDYVLVFTADGTDMKAYRIESSTVTEDGSISDPRTSTITWSQGTNYVGGLNGGTTSIFDGAITYLAMHVDTVGGRVDANFPEFLNNLADDEMELRGAKYMAAKFGEGRLYIGGDYETYTSNAFQPLRARGSMGLWFRPVFDATDGLAWNPRLFHITSSGTDNMHVDYNVATDKFDFVVVAGGTNKTLSSSAQTFADGDLIHVAWTWDESNLKLYIDGVLAQSTAVAAEVTLTGELAVTWALGNTAAAARDTPAYGVIDHMKASNYVWTATQIANEAAATVPDV